MFENQENSPELDVMDDNASKSTSPLGHELTFQPMDEEYLARAADTVQIS